MAEPNQTGPIAPLFMQICALNRGRMHALWHSIGLHRGQPFVLRILWAEEGLTQTELARRLHRTPATITNMLQRLQKAGFVERRSDPQDQRISRVYLTEAGYEIQAQVEQVWQEDETRTLGGFSDREIATLRGYLERIRDNLLGECTSSTTDLPCTMSGEQL
jgi:DNA-binding MarR family transcriptional regulator